MKKLIQGEIILSVLKKKGRRLGNPVRRVSGLVCGKNWSGRFRPPDHLALLKNT